MLRYFAAVIVAASFAAGSANAEEVPKLSRLDGQWDAVKSAFEKGDCRRAMTLMDSYMADVNFLVDAMLAATGPMSRANQSELPSYREEIQTLMPSFEKASRHREYAIEGNVMVAECLKNQGDHEAAVKMYKSAMDGITIQNHKLWMRASSGMLDIIE